MTTPKYLHELLSQIGGTPSWDPKIPEDSKLDLSKIPEEMIDETFDALDGLFTFRNGLDINKAIASSLDKSELSAAEKILDGFRQALLRGEVSLTRLRTGQIAPFAGIDPDEVIQEIPINKASMEQLKDHLQAMATATEKFEKLKIPESLLMRENMLRNLAHFPAPSSSAQKSSRSYVNVKFHWWGVRVYLSDDLIKDLLALLALGGSISGALIYFGVPAIVAVIIAAFIGFIATVNRREKGVYVYVTWNGVWWVRGVS